MALQRVRVRVGEAALFCLTGDTNTDSLEGQEACRWGCSSGLRRLLFRPIPPTCGSFALLEAPFFALALLATCFLFGATAVDDPGGRHRVTEDPDPIGATLLHTALFFLLMVGNANHLVL